MQKSGPGILSRCPPPKLASPVSPQQEVQRFSLHTTLYVFVTVSVHVLGTFVQVGTVQCDTNTHLTVTLPGTHCLSSFKSRLPLKLYSSKVSLTDETADPSVVHAIESKTVQEL